jgi:Protein of unknown function (DUF2892)
MKKNIGLTDRLIRLAFAIVLFLFAWWQSSWIAFGFGLFCLYEAISSWCLFYQIIGKNTCPLDRK